MLAEVLAQVALTMLTGRSEGSSPDLVPHITGHGAAALRGRRLSQPAAA